MAKNPDRFERMVADKHFNDRSDAADAIALLHEEHAAVLRTVKAYRNSCRPSASDRCVEAWEAWYHIEKTCEDILKRLAKRKG